jgi:putative Mg2+ transporter-C (MgtC) family protein
MDTLNEQLFNGLTNGPHIVRVLVRLVVAVVMGGLIGYEREREHREAGLRTHMLVALGAALFILIPIEAGTDLQGLGRVVQGLTAGIGFLGAGTILQLPAERRIKGLTTAGSIWVTAAVGVAVGFGWLWPAIAAVVLSWVVLYFVHLLEPRFKDQKEP